jgi:hypothetical protein
VTAQIDRADTIIFVTDDVSDEPAIAGPTIVKQHRCFAHGWVPPQHHLDLSELDTETANFYLLVYPA